MWNWESFEFGIGNAECGMKGQREEDRRQRTDDRKMVSGIGCQDIEVLEFGIGDAECGKEKKAQAVCMRS